MDDYRTKSWKVMADYGCGLYDDRGAGTSPDDEEINAHDDFIRRFEAWVSKYCEENMPLDVESFNKEGLGLAVELKKIVGPEIVVTYRYERAADDKSSEPDEEEIGWLS